MRASLYCIYDICDGSSHKEKEVFIMPYSEEEIAHISSPVFPRKSPLAEAIYEAIFSSKQKFLYEGKYCTILSYRFFKSGQTKKYKKFPKMKKKSCKKKKVRNIKSMSKRLSIKSSLHGLNGNAYQPYQGGKFTPR